MEENLRDSWASAMNSLGVLSEEKREHFALMLIKLADCYVDAEASATILIQKDGQLTMFSAGATELESACVIQAAHKLMTEVVTYDAPPKEMFN